MALLPVEEALARILDGVTALKAESVGLLQAPGRVLAEDVAAKLTQPPFDASAMDGYAVRAADARDVHTTLRVIGESQAGRRFAGSATSPRNAPAAVTARPRPSTTAAGRSPIISDQLAATTRIGSAP